MILSIRMQNRLNRCRKASLQNPIQLFLRTWTNHNATASDCYQELRLLCGIFDNVGEYHDAEEIMLAGRIVLDDEVRRQRELRVRARNERTLLTVGGLVLGGLLVSALVSKR